MEGSLVAYKVFTNGSTLQASEINENLMRQATAVFSNAAARTAAITSPVEGQLTYLEDTNQYASWNGSAWVSPFGTTLIVSQDFTSTSSLVVNDVFTSEFDSYQILFDFTSAGAAGDPSFQLRVSGSSATSNYNWVRNQAFGTGASVTTTSASSSFTIGRIETTGGIVNMLLNNPGRALGTFGTTNSFDGTLVLSNFGLWHSTATAYTGFNCSLSNATGNVKVYGLRK
jgi:hypothetical protein